MSKWGRKKKDPPPGFEYVEPTLTILDNELREKVNEPHEGLRKTESQWPVHQINWQKSRYIYDMYYTYQRISKQVYDYCIENKLADAALIAKWKKPGYERLCSTFAINPQNYKFGTVSICRVPASQLPPGTELEDPATGCRGCASGSRSNIFGNKYGQYLAAIQIAREERIEKGRGERGEEADDAIDNDDSVAEEEIVGLASEKESGKRLWAESDGEAEALRDAAVGTYSVDADREAREVVKRLGAGASWEASQGPGKRSRI